MQINGETPRTGFVLRQSSGLIVGKSSTDVTMCTWERASWRAPFSSLTSSKAPWPRTVLSSNKGLRLGNMSWLRRKIKSREEEAHSKWSLFKNTVFILVVKSLQCVRLSSTPVTLSWPAQFCDWRNFVTCSLTRQARTRGRENTSPRICPCYKFFPNGSLW